MIQPYFANIEQSVPLNGIEAKSLKDAYNLGMYVARKEVNFTDENKKLIEKLRLKTFKLTQSSKHIND